MGDGICFRAHGVILLLAPKVPSAVQLDLYKRDWISRKLLGEEDVEKKKKKKKALATSSAVSCIVMWTLWEIPASDSDLKDLGSSLGFIWIQISHLGVWCAIKCSVLLGL